jgi:outer membrane protein assembly factor BamE (lipoprotein component of BamABCDE complex)
MTLPTINRLGITMVLALAALAACSPRTAIRGNLVTESQVARIKVGETNQRTASQLLGPPSARSTFDKQIWYYIGTREEKWAFMNPSIDQQRVVAVYFNERGVVERVQHYNEAHARDIDVVSRETPTTGRSVGFFEQIFGNIGAAPPR